MSVATEIQRIQNAKAGIKAALEGKEVTVPSTTKIDGYPSLVESIPSGGGSTEYVNVTFNGGNTFYFVGITDSGQQDGSVNINSGTTLRVVKNSLILVGKMDDAGGTQYISGTSDVSFAKIKDNFSGILTNFNTMPESISNPVRVSGSVVYGVTALFATQDINVYADLD